METDLCFIADSNLADSAKTTDQAFNIAKDFRSYCGSGSTYSKRTKRLHGAVGQELSEKTATERRRCRDWLIPFMNDQPKFLTKDELRVAAMRQLNGSKSSFDFVWIDAIEPSYPGK
jgi:hypothetical protein